MTPPAGALRVITLNLWHTATSLSARLEAAAAEIRERAPHVVCLQEVPQSPDGSHAAELLARWSGIPLAGAGGFGERGAVGERSGLAILSGLPVSEVSEVALPGRDAAGTLRAALVARMQSPAGRPLVVATTHLAWGGAVEAARLGQAVALDGYLAGLPEAGAPGAVVVLSGDLNTGPDGDTLRFLRGQGVVEGGSTCYLDAWEVAGQGPGHTTGPDNPWAAHTAAQVGITVAAQLPRRRIDFILVRGWVYGRAGAPLAARRVFTDARAVTGGQRVHASDHYGVEADLADPAATSV